MSNPLDNCRQLDNKADVSSQKSDHADRLVQAINDLGVESHTNPVILKWRSNKQGQTVDELKTRKRMEVLTEAKKEATIL